MNRFPYYVRITEEQAREHLTQASKLAPTLHKTAYEGTAKPFDAALALHLAMCAICKEYGWHPKDFAVFTRAEFPDEQLPINDCPPS